MDNVSTSSTSLPEICILAGGRSSRFPGDKALAKIAGRPQLVQLIQQLKDQGYNCSVVADRSDRYSAIGIECLADIYPTHGPLGGLVTGLQQRLDHSGSGWLLVLGCDQLIWRSEWLCGMEQLLSEVGQDNWSAAIWADREIDQVSLANPIPGLYHTKLLPLIHECCQNGQLALRTVLSMTSVNVYCNLSHREHPNSYSFNSPAQLSRLLELI